MKTAIALLAVLAWSTLYAEVEAETEKTWISNQNSQWTIDVTILYNFAGNPEFQDRQLGPGNSDHDEYQGSFCDGATFGGDPTPVKVHVHINAASVESIVLIPCDRSLLFVDSTTLHSGVDVYLSEYGNINQAVGNVITTLSAD